MPKNKKPAEKVARDLDYQTPPELVEAAHRYAPDGRVTLDPATIERNPVGARLAYYLPDRDGLALPWYDDDIAGHLNGSPWTTFVNPPYGGETRPWLAKVGEEADRCPEHGGAILLLISIARTEQYYAQQVLAKANMVCFLRGRVPFVRPTTGERAYQNMHASVVWGFNADEDRFTEAYSPLGLCIRVQATSGALEKTPWARRKRKKKAKKKPAAKKAEAPPPQPPEPEPEEPVDDPFCDDAVPLADDPLPEDEVVCAVCFGGMTTTPDGQPVCENGHGAPPTTAKTKSGWGGAGVRRVLPTVDRSSGPGPIADLQAWRAEVLEKLDGRPVIVSVSGGKDSTALCLLLKEADIPYTAIHMDTGWEHEATERYVRDYLPDVIGPIEILQSHLGGMEELVKRRGMFPSRIRRFCTQELKVRPFKRYLRKLQDAGEDPVNAVGIRAGESKARSKLGEWEDHKDFDCLVWRPLIDWSEQDVIDMHHRHGVKPNPLYLQGATRVGCWPCIFARKKEIRMIADLDPERIARLRRLEEEVQDAAAKRYAAEGETFETKGYAPPTWFQNPTHRTNRAKGKRSGRCWPIDKVVEWSRTKRGGKEEELFAPPYAEEGCMRWGLCETVPPEQERENAEARAGQPTLEEQKAAALAEDDAELAASQERWAAWARGREAAARDPALEGFL